MSLDLRLFNQRRIIHYNGCIPNFRREIRQSEDKYSIKYNFGFPKINKSRYSLVNIFDKNSDELPKAVVDYFSLINDDSFIAYLKDFYPNGYPNRKNERIIKDREGKGVGTAGFELIKEDLKKINVKNMFIIPLNAKMEEFLLKSGFNKITQSRPWKNFSYEVRIYGTVLV